VVSDETFTYWHGIKFMRVTPRMGESLRYESVQDGFPAAYFRHDNGQWGARMLDGLCVFAGTRGAALMLATLKAEAHYRAEAQRMSEVIGRNP
jgi:hypothetical protein